MWFAFWTSSPPTPQFFLMNQLLIVEYCSENGQRKLLKEKRLEKPGMIGHSCNPSTWEMRQEDKSSRSSSALYSSTPARAT